MNGKEVLEAIKQGAEITPTDKSYKIYVTIEQKQIHDKAYFYDFTEEEFEEFMNMYKEGKMRMAYPGYFYTMPYRK